MIVRPTARLRTSGLRRWIATALAALAVAAVTGVTSGCGGASGALMTPKEIEAHGIMRLRGSPEKVFKASLEALKAIGYEIAVEQPDKGLIVTKRRSVGDIVVGKTPAPADASYSRQYTIEIKGGGGGVTRVTATPAIFENTADISPRPVWDLESSLGERELWKQLFAKIEQLL